MKYLLKKRLSVLDYLLITSSALIIEHISIPIGIVIFFVGIVSIATLEVIFEDKYQDKHHEY